MLQKLRKNRENVPLLILKTKYAKPYNELLEKIQFQTKEIIMRYLFSGMLVDADDEEDFQVFFKASQSILDAEAEAGTLKEIGLAVYLEYDIDKALDIAVRKIRPKILYDAYAPYWLKHCISHEDGGIWNDLIDMMWNNECGMWINSEKSEGRLMLPPTEELIKEERTKYGY